MYLVFFTTLALPEYLSSHPSRRAHTRTRAKLSVPPPLNCACPELKANLELSDEHAPPRSVMRHTCRRASAHFAHTHARAKLSLRGVGNSLPLLGYFS